ncbi:hypothetical protein Tsp_06371 [Trichinella spiralis]|uniref:hypothetical protein n=1 Tax=Trichinella spiralis TaxID=6334 RepID=UPI0001EFC0D2|nr:hypothetical protein Tsp_06371 [Trichinella spiralis]
MEIIFAKDLHIAALQRATSTSSKVRSFEQFAKWHFEEELASCPPNAGKQARIYTNWSIVAIYISIERRLWRCKWAIKNRKMVTFWPKRVQARARWTFLQAAWSQQTATASIKVDQIKNHFPIQ